jgi:hypothetical protein
MSWKRYGGGGGNNPILTTINGINQKHYQDGK